MEGLHRSGLALVGLLASCVTLSARPAADDGAGCKDLPSHANVKAALEQVVDTVPPFANAGLGNEMWASLVNRDGIVCVVAFSGDDRNDQLPVGRVVSAQKANTANAFSLEAQDGSGGALSSGNLYGRVLEQGSLYGLQFGNPVDTAIAYGGPNHAGGSPNNYGRPNDPMVGEFIGGVNVTGGGSRCTTARASFSARSESAETLPAPTTSWLGAFASSWGWTTCPAGSVATIPTI
jgi:hypothetical protein